MTKRVFIVHGWSGYPQEGWFPWLKSELEQKGFEVQVPAMPHSDEPIIRDWVSHLSSVVGVPNSETFFVGHSIGCQTILRYLETLNSSVGGAVFVAGFTIKVTLEAEDPEEQKEEIRIRTPWLETPINYGKVLQVCPHIIAIFGEDDPVVPFEPNQAAFREKLGAKIVVEQGKGHFSGDDGVTELPSVLEALENMRA